MMYSPSADRPFHHVAVAVHSIAESRALYELLTGEGCSTPETLESQGVKVAFVGQVELLEPLYPDSTVGRFLARVRFVVGRIEVVPHPGSRASLASSRW